MKRKSNLFVLGAVVVISMIIMTHSYINKKTYISCDFSGEKQILSWNKTKLFYHDKRDTSKILSTYKIEINNSEKIQAKEIKEKQNTGKLDLGISWNEYIFINRIAGTAIIGNTFDEVTKKDNPDLILCNKISKNDLTKPKF